MKRDEIWVSDFTYLKFKEKFIYLATIMNLFTLEIVGFTGSITPELGLGALEDAVFKNNPPYYPHSDQGSEYDHKNTSLWAEGLGIKISMSAKSSPGVTRNLFYSQFKVDLGISDRF